MELKKPIAKTQSKDDKKIQKRKADPGPFVDDGSYANVFTRPLNEDQAEVGYKGYVAIKVSKPNEERSLLWEASTLLRLRHVPGVIPVYQVKCAPDRTEIHMPFIDTNLDEIIRRNPQIMDKQFVQSVMKQLLQTVSMVHYMNIIHCDIKPSNILYCFKTKKVFLIDFGFAVDRLIPVHALPVQTEWWRSPEILYLGQNPAGRFDEKIDIWSLGVIMVDMIFKTMVIGEKADAKEQDPNVRYLRAIDAMRQELYSCQGQIRQQFGEYCYDLLTCLLQPNPVKRLSAAAALKHSFFTLNSNNGHPSRLQKSSKNGR